MNLKRVVGNVMLAVMLLGVAGLMSGCFGIPKGTMKMVKISTANVEAEGAGIVSANEKAVVYKVQCGLCGYESEEFTIPTPSRNKPYVIEWTCPKCGHTQTIRINVVPST